MNEKIVELIQKNILTELANEINKVKEDAYKMLNSKDKYEPVKASTEDVFENLYYLTKVADSESSQDNKDINSRYMSLKHKKMLMRLLSFDYRTEYKTTWNADESIVYVEAYIYPSMDANTFLGCGKVGIPYDSVCTNEFLSDNKRKTEAEALARGSACTRALGEIIALPYYGDCVEPELLSERMKKELEEENEKTSTLPSQDMLPSEESTKVAEIRKATKEELKNEETGNKRNKSKLDESNSQTPTPADATIKSSKNVDGPGSMSSASTTPLEAYLLENQTEEQELEFDDEDEELPMDTPVDSMTLEQARNVKCDVGRGVELGYTLGDIEIKQYKNLRWTYQNTKSEHVRAAIKVIYDNNDDVRQHFYEGGYYLEK